MATRLLWIVDSKESQLEDEITQLYEATFHGLFRYAMAIVREREVAEDAIQECFLRYFVARKDEQSILNARAWLYRVLRNQLLDLRKKASLKEARIDAAVNYPDWGRVPRPSCGARSCRRAFSRCSRRASWSASIFGLRDCPTRRSPQSWESARGRWV